RRRLVALGFVALSNVMGLINDVIKWIVGRTRPFRFPEDIAQPAPFILHPFRGGLGGMFTQANLAFPSGHGAIAFATATALAILFPRWRLAFYAVAALVGIERIAENAHYLSDVVGAAGLSVIGVHLIW